MDVHIHQLRKRLIYIHDVLCEYAYKEMENNDKDHAARIIFE